MIVTRLAYDQAAADAVLADAGRYEVLRQLMEG